MHECFLLSFCYPWQFIFLYNFGRYFSSRTVALQIVGWWNLGSWTKKFGFKTLCKAYPGENKSFFCMNVRKEPDKKLVWISCVVLEITVYCLKEYAPRRRSFLYNTRQNLGSKEAASFGWQKEVFHCCWYERYWWKTAESNISNWLP